MAEVTDPFLARIYGAGTKPAPRKSAPSTSTSTTEEDDPFLARIYQKTTPAQASPPPPKKQESVLPAWLQQRNASDAGEGIVSTSAFINTRPVVQRPTVSANTEGGGGFLREAQRVGITALNKFDPFGALSAIGVKTGDEIDQPRRQQIAQTLPEPLRTQYLADEHVNPDEPHTAVGRFIANTTAGLANFGTEVAGAEILGVPAITGLNPFGSAALVGGIIPTVRGKQSPFEYAMNVGGDELLGQAMKAPTAGQRFVRGAAITGGETALTQVASGKELKPGEITRAAVEGGVMSLGGHVAEEAVAQQGVGFKAMSLKNDRVTLDGLHPEAQATLSAMDDVLAQNKLRSVITEGVGGKEHEGHQSNHNAGEDGASAVDLRYNKKVYHALKNEGFDVSIERAGQRNANGTQATANHIHVELRKGQKAEEIATQFKQTQEQNDATTTGQEEYRAEHQNGGTGGQESGAVEGNRAERSPEVGSEHPATEVQSAGQQEGQVNTLANPPGAPPIRQHAIGLFGSERPSKTFIARKIPFNLDQPRGTEFKVDDGSGVPQTYTTDFDLGHVEHADGTRIDAMSGETASGNHAYIVDRFSPDGSFAGHTIVGRVSSANDAVDMVRNIYDDQHASGVEVHDVTQMPLRLWLEHGDPAKPFGEQKSDAEQGAAALTSKPKGKSNAVQIPDTERPVASGDGAQPVGTPDGISGDGQDRQLDAEGRAPRAADRTGDLGEGSVRRSGTPAPESAEGGAAAKETSPAQENSNLRADSFSRSITNEETARVREKYGLPDREDPGVHPWAEARAEALRATQEDRNAGPSLVKELQKKPRALEDWEDRLLAHELTLREDAYDHADADLAKSPGDANKIAAVKEARLHLQDAADAYDKSGTIGARGLNARKGAEDREFSLRGMLRDAKTHDNLGAKLSDGQEAHVAEQYRAIREQRDAVASKERSADALRSERTLTEVFQSERKAEPALDVQKLFTDDLAEIRSIVEGVKSGNVWDKLGESLSKRKSAADAYWKSRSSKLGASTGIDPEGAYHLAVDAAYYAHEGLTDFAAWAEEKTEQIGEWVRPHLEAAWEAGKARIDALSPLKDKPRGDAKYDASAGLTQQNIFNAVRERVRQYIDENPDKITVDKDAIFPDVLKRLQQDHPSLTEDDLHQKFSRYGETTRPSQERDLKFTRQLRAMSRNNGWVRDILAGRAPKRTGPQRDPLSPEARAERHELQAMMRDQGIEATDPATQVRTPMDAMKARAQNRIEDLDKQIAEGKRRSMGARVAPDAELQRLRDKAAARQRVLDEIDPPAPKSIEERQQLAESALEARIYSLSKEMTDFAKGGFPKSGEDVPETPRLKEQRELLSDLNKEYDELKKENVEYQKQVAQKQNETMRSAIAKKYAETQERLEKKDYSKPTTDELVLERETEIERNKLAQIQYKWRAERAKAEKAAEYKAHPMQKYLDAIPKARRLSFLLSVPIYTKLAFAALTRIAQTPIEQALGEALGRVPGIKTVAANAPREGRFSGEAEKAAFQKFTSMWRHPAQRLKSEIIKGVPMDISARFEKPSSEIMEWDHVVGRSHQYFKNPVKAAEFVRSRLMRIAHERANGTEFDATNEHDPVTKAIDKASYEDAKGSIFMRPNWVVTKYRGLVNQMAASQNWSEQTMARVMRFTFPIISIPTNLTIEGFRTTPLGLVEGGFRMLRAVAKEGLKNMPEAEADATMRAFKKGSIGTAAVLVGYYSPQTFGGFFTPGDERSPEDAQPDQIKIGDFRLPSVFAHTPLALALMLGATIRRVQDATEAKGDDGGLGRWIAFGTVGMAESVPFVDFVKDLGKEIEDPTNAYNTALNPIMAMFSSGFVRNAASAADLNWKGEKPTLGEGVAGFLFGRSDVGMPRKPENPFEAWEMGIPGLRESVPIKEKRLEQLRERSIDPKDESSIDAGVESGRISHEKAKKMKAEIDKSPFEKKAASGKLKERIDWFEQLPQEKRDEVREILQKRVNKAKRGSLTQEQFEALKGRAEELLSQ